jgi:ubiquitin thioesterase protein OTUB1
MNNVKQTKELLIEAGFEWIAIQDFYEIFVEELEKVHPDKRNASKEQDSGQAIALTELVSTFQTDYQSNAIVVYLRFITSAYLKVNSENYLPFIISDGYENMDQFCVSQVEAIGRESDEIHIIAICKALQLQVTVAYLDGRPNFAGGNEDKDDSLMMANLYNFPDSEYKSPFLPPIYLLYRPGHYDILYSNP